MEALKIVAFATLAAIAYGILHDQVTAHVCVEYFTIAHPPVFPTQSPFWLAIGWGIIATWWVGLPLGIGLALAARIGSAPKLAVGDLMRPVAVLMLACLAIAFATGGIGALVSANGGDAIGYWREVIPPEKWTAFAFDAWAHSASYLAGAVGGLFVIVRTALKRRRSSRSA